MNAGRKLFYFLSASIFILSSHRKSSLCVGVLLPHHIVNFPSGFDLLPVVKPALLLGCEIQEITSRPV